MLGFSQIYTVNRMKHLVGYLKNNAISSKVESAKWPSDWPLLHTGLLMNLIKFLEVVRLDWPHNYADLMAIQCKISTCTSGYIRVYLRIFLHGGKCFMSKS